jgi:hypothetical protein
VVQPDGTLALVPSWMGEAAAGSAALTTCPRLSVGRLIELRARLDALLASSPGESAPRGGGDHAPTAQHNWQRDLFEADRKPAEFPAAQRRELVRLIESLLGEAVAECEAVAQSGGLETKEVAHEQDHACPIAAARPSCRLISRGPRPSRAAKAISRDADPVGKWGRQHGARRQGEPCSGLAWS